MTNFDFLQKDSQFKAFADSCVEAEKSIATSPALCAIGVRKSTELAVKWLYSVDPDLVAVKPYKDNLSALVYNDAFVDSVDQDIMNRLRYIIHVGNFAAHTSKRVSYKDAVIALSCLFDFILFIDYCYGSTYEDRKFNESLLAADNDQSVPAAELAKLQAELDARSLERESLVEQVRKLQAAMAALKKQNQQKRIYHSNNISEAETRKNIIDIDIKSMGWVFGSDCIVEYAVTGMPNATGTGYVDYVLMGDNGKPLAVVEAKKTTVDPKAGKHQASLYAKCLEDTTGQRPLIFYTNGYETWFWDDLNYPERKVYSVFSKQDLQRIVDRRIFAKEFKRLNIKPEITDRDYQKIAIQRVCKEYGNKRRKALLVMATGTGKTRTAVSLVDVLTEHAWITNILFLADRKELVKQAKNAFTKYMPNLSACNLLDRGKDSPADRAIFSTYPTIMNAINEEKTANGQKLFTPAHFDLIIVDEAHRSIFKKYRAIFEYFDALLVGLTATPKDDVDHNTYAFFDLDDNMPTYAYEYAKALKDGYLVDYHCIQKTYKIPTKGLRYQDLTPEQRRLFEEAFEEGEEIPEVITGKQINKLYFNINTTNRILGEIMSKGLKVCCGDKLGKTIIFARNHDHAVFIEDRFNKLFPEYSGKFARVIDVHEKYHEALLADFKDKDKYPQIAISVDMLDTGIDVPEILNLVFYKQVFSKTKFWQMFGRGTRLCEDIFGPGKDKKEFYIFDYLGNFKFFNQKPKGKDAADQKSLSERIFGLKVNIVRELQATKYQTEELIPFRKKLINELSGAISSLNTQQFQVRQNLSFVEKYSSPEAFQSLDITTTKGIISHLAKLIPVADDDEYARRFDALMFRVILCRLETSETACKRIVSAAEKIAVSLAEKATIADVSEAKETLTKMQSEAFWREAALPEIDKIRKEIRGLIHFMKKEMKTRVIDVIDEVIFEDDGGITPDETDLGEYYERASRYVTENAGNPVLGKLKNNIPLLGNDWIELEKIFWHEVGTEAEYKKAVNADVPLGKFVRSLTGLSEKAAHAAFSEFLDERVYSESQIYFVQCIMDWIMKYGTLDKKYIGRANFANGLDFTEVFENKVKEFNALLKVVENINNNAMPMAA